MKKYKQINIKKETHLKIKTLASKRGQSIVDFLDKMINFYYDVEMKK